MFKQVSTFGARRTEPLFIVSSREPLCAVRPDVATGSAACLVSFLMPNSISDVTAAGICPLDSSVSEIQAMLLVLLPRPLPSIFEFVEPREARFEFVSRLLLLLELNAFGNPETEISAPFAFDSLTEDETACCAPVLNCTCTGIVIELALASVRSLWFRANVGKVELAGVAKLTEFAATPDIGGSAVMVVGAAMVFPATLIAVAGNVPVLNMTSPPPTELNVTAVGFVTVIVSLLLLVPK